MCAVEQVEPHAVRWAKREVRNEPDYTRWHWTTGACLTLCGVLISLISDGWPHLPETDERIEIVDCRRCLAALKLKRQGRAQAETAT